MIFFENKFLFDLVLQQKKKTSSGRTMKPMQLKKLLQEIIPALTPFSHKGQAGRLCVVGGSQEYTGAPYYAGFSALRGGADLCTVACQDTAAIAIKSYSPELIVEPLFNLSQQQQQQENNSHFATWVSTTLPRFSAVIIGPGMGRNSNMFVYVRDIILQSLNNKIPLVLDGDALYLLSIPSNRNLLLQSQAKNDKKNQEQKQNDGDTNDGEKNDFVILTPNAMEFRRLWINNILNKDIEKYNSKSIENKNDYLPAFDATDIFNLLKPKLAKKSDDKNTNNKNSEIKIPATDECLNCKDFSHIRSIQDTAKLANAYVLY